MMACSAGHAPVRTAPQSRIAGDSECRMDRRLAQVRIDQQYFCALLRQHGRATDRG